MGEAATCKDWPTTSFMRSVSVVTVMASRSLRVGLHAACRAEWKPRLEQQMAICDYIYDHVYDMMQHGLAKPSAHACNMICTGLKTKRPRMAFDAARA